jgi:hypothetical protein
MDNLAGPRCFWFRAYIGKFYKIYLRDFPWTTNEWTTDHQRKQCFHVAANCYPICNMHWLWRVCYQFCGSTIVCPLIGEFNYTGFWNAPLVSILIIISSLLGIVIYLAASNKKFRVEDSFTGGETLGAAAGFSVLDFYKTLNEFEFLSALYRKAENKWFDIYDLSKKIVLGFSKILSNAHTGVLSQYILWAIIGFILMLIFMM